MRSRASRLSMLIGLVFPWMGMSMGCGPPSSIDVDEVLKNLETHLGKQVVIKARFKSGARCRQTGERWQTYCKDNCQYCKGPLVVDTKLDLPAQNLDDWPMILGGLHEGKDIRCKGPLNAVDCYPFVLGKLYVVRGLLERNHPPRLLVDELWPIEEPGRPEMMTRDDDRR